RRRRRPRRSGPAPAHRGRIDAGRHRRRPSVVGLHRRRRSVRRAAPGGLPGRADRPAARRSSARRVCRLVPRARRARVDGRRRHGPARRRAPTLMLRAFRVPLTWTDLLKRTYREIRAGNCLGLAAQLAYYFFLALFPALLFLVALASFFPIAHVMDSIT